MDKKYININCDVGEGIANEEQLFPYISSCNIACGGHFGTVDTIRKTVQLAIKNDVKIGAHPSYPDRVNFGRVSMHMKKDVFVKSIQEQMHNIETILHQKKEKLHHIKAHGALYNDIAKDLNLAKSFLEAVSEYKSRVCLYVPYGSLIAEEALKQEFSVKYEAFADRNYNANLSLVSRKSTNALIEHPKAVLEHIRLMVHQEKVQVISGELVSIKAETFCIHGDTISALDILIYLSRNLPKLNIFKSV
ncbi:5-oxoprolinase subunit PxpA [Maribacter sp.]|uniref:5-oxoprolinase subunit PxpA n=1 Tax=Maribacter sp. TaxID=1897614 RepID=UPI0025B8FF09|nr:5-oxoprolinase subunit PxpA [Maribacter sp.]